MVKCWEELGDVLAEFENRLSCLENSIPNIREEEPKQVIETKVIFRRLPVDHEVAYLKNKLTAHIDASKKEDLYE